MVLMPYHMEELEKLYKVAKNDDKDTFMFKGQEMSTNYVKYLIEYLKLKEKK